jgi:hypothetical protein
MVYADTGVGKSMFALSAALAVAGSGEFLGWKPDQKANGAPWKVLYVDGEMHIGDIQERARLLLNAVPNVDRDRARENLRFIARQHQNPGEMFPSITEESGSQFILQRVKNQKLDLVVLDNFSTLGEVEDENAASSFNKSGISTAVKDARRGHDACAPLRQATGIEGARSPFGPAAHVAVDHWRRSEELDKRGFVYGGGATDYCSYQIRRKGGRVCPFHGGNTSSGPVGPTD